MQTDYLIIGAGASGLAFADELLNHSDAHLTLVDKRHAPGGHWNDAYPFVRLHQPSVFYGVESMRLRSVGFDTEGLNKGYLQLADGAEVNDYFHRVMKERLLASGRVNFIPMTEVTAEGKLRSVLSGEERDITVNKKTVDAAFATNSVPQTHKRKFTVAEAVSCVPPNDVPRLAGDHKHFTVLGAGKTAIDTVVWLLSNGAKPDAIRWVVPRDPWLWNRDITQPHETFYNKVFGGFADRLEAIANATTPADMALRHEASGVWIRLFPDVEPQFFHGATCSQAEIDIVRQVSDVVRLGRVEAIDEHGMKLQQGEVAGVANSLYVDCTASALSKGETKPIFEDDRITLQMVRFPQVSFSAAFLAYLEAIESDTKEKNRLAQPLPLPDSMDDYVQTLFVDMMNRLQCSQHKQLRAWTTESKLEGYAKIARSTDKSDTERMAILQRISEQTAAAAKNIPNLLRVVGSRD